MSDPNNLDSTLTFYNFPNTCIEHGESMYVGNYKIEVGKSFSTSGFLEVKAVEMSVKNLAPTDMTEIAKLLPLEGPEVSIAVPIDLTGRQIKAMEQYVQKLNQPN